MTQQVDAIYENGVLRPLGKLGLSEHEKVRISVSREGDELESILDQAFVQSCEGSVTSAPSLEEVRQGLSGIVGSMVDAVRTDRDG